MKKIISLATSIAVAFGGLILPLAPAMAATAPNWTLNAPASISFMCGGSSYAHTINSLVQDVNGTLTGTGTYDPDHGYTWNLVGNIVGDAITYTITYTGTAAGSVYTNTGTIAPDGSVSGTSTGNCQTFTMPAGSVVPATPVAMCPANTVQKLVETVTVPSTNPAPTPTVSSLTSGKQYLFVASGTWTNRNNASEDVDAEYATLDNWTSVMDGYNITPYFLGMSEFDLQLNGGFITWGAYNATHSYSYLYTGTGSPASFTVFDGDSTVSSIPNAGWYGDNAGNLTVQVYSCAKKDKEDKDDERGHDKDKDHKDDKNKGSDKDKDQRNGRKDK